MVDKNNLYKSSSALGGTQDPSTPRVREERFTLCFRNGRTASYPYHFVSLVEMIGREEIVLHCTCGNVESITIRGRNLTSLASDLCRQSTAEIREWEREEFTAAGVVIKEIAITRTAKNQSSSPLISDDEAPQGKTNPAESEL